MKLAFLAMIHPQMTTWPFCLILPLGIYRYALTDKEMAFDAADMFRMGQDIIIQHSAVTNKPGTERLLWFRQEKRQHLFLTFVDLLGLSRSEIQENLPLRIPLKMRDTSLTTWAAFVSPNCIQINICVLLFMAFL